MNQVLFPYGSKNLTAEDVRQILEKEDERIYERMKPKYEDLSKCFQKEEAMTDRIKLEDMTMREIGELKCNMANDIRKAITDIVCKYNESHDCGIPNIKVSTDIGEEVFEFEGVWDVEKITHVKYDIRIKFSKED